MDSITYYMKTYRRNHQSSRVKNEFNQFNQFLPKSELVRAKRLNRVDIQARTDSIELIDLQARNDSVELIDIQA